MQDNERQQRIRAMQDRPRHLRPITYWAIFFGALLLMTAMNGVFQHLRYGYIYWQ